MKTVSTGYHSVTPGNCPECGADDDYECDGRGNVTCGCQSCPGCGSRDVYGFHERDCTVITDARARAEQIKGERIAAREDDNAFDRYLEERASPYGDGPDWD